MKLNEVNKGTTIVDIDTSFFDDMGLYKIS